MGVNSCADGDTCSTNSDCISNDCVGTTCMSKYVVIEAEQAEDHPKREQNLCLFFSKITKCLKNQALMFFQE